MTQNQKTDTEEIRGKVGQESRLGQCPGATSTPQCKRVLIRSGSATDWTLKLEVDYEIWRNEKPFPCAVNE